MTIAFNSGFSFSICNKCAERSSRALNSPASNKSRISNALSSHSFSSLTSTFDHTSNKPGAKTSRSQYQKLSTTDWREIYDSWMATNREKRTATTVELLQTMIQNACVNDGTADSGNEGQPDAFQTFLEGPGIDIETWNPPGRKSPSLVSKKRRQRTQLVSHGHTDVVPVNPDGWSGSLRRRIDRWRRGSAPSL